MADAIANSIKAIAERWIRQGWQEGKASVVDELHATNFVDRDPAGRSPDREGFSEGIQQLYAAFPDFHAVIEDFVVDATTGKVAIRWSATGTHRGAFLGIPPTDRSIAFKGIEIILIENEHIVERWGEWDGIALRQQLGRLGG